MLRAKAFAAAGVADPLLLRQDRANPLRFQQTTHPSAGGIYGAAVLDPAPRRYDYLVRDPTRRSRTARSRDEAGSMHAAAAVFNESFHAA